MKKILLLGGSAQQVIGIKTGKRLGYYTVLCDYLPDNPGQYVADKYYNVNTTDIEVIAMYKRLGFDYMKIKNEHRPDDVHFYIEL